MWGGGGGVYMCVSHSMCAEFRGYSLRESVLAYHVDSRGQTQVVRVGGI